MNKEKIQYIVAGVLIIVFVFVVLNPPKKPNQGSTRAGSPVENFQEVLDHYGKVARTSINTDAVLEAKSRFTGGAFKRDPFAFLVEVEVPEIIIEEEIIVVPEEEVDVGPAPDFEIEGIIFDAAESQNSVAIIFGTEKREGDKVLDWTIEAIGDTTITFRKGTRKHVVNLYDPKPKKNGKEEVSSEG